MSKPNLFASTIITKADLKGLKISFNIDFYNYYKWYKLFPGCYAYITDIMNNAWIMMLPFIIHY